MNERGRLSRCVKVVIVCRGVRLYNKKEEMYRREMRSLQSTSDKVPSPTRWLFHPLFAAIGDGHCRTFTASSPIPERTQRLENARRSFAAAKLEPTEMSPVSEFGAAGDGCGGDIGATVVALECPLCTFLFVGEVAAFHRCSVASGRCASEGPLCLSQQKQTALKKTDRITHKTCHGTRSLSAHGSHDAIALERFQEGRTLLLLRPTSGPTTSSPLSSFRGDSVRLNERI
ncbi:hypothetical protein BHE74_00004582 [Ensete ventricosum]|nr:hypothetical protein BHE74_00004582 [Ensete ventricosum]RZR82776.1 hypothetical protein BHM03_00009260 [Ensete ventricosum]